MDNSVLTEQRRETVINLLKGMKIKKTDGDGFDKDDVYVCMQQLCDVYEKSIEDLTANYEEQIAEMQDKYQKYDENNDLYISLIMEAKKSSNEIISKAKAEVDEILNNGKEQIAKQEEELESARKAAEQEKANLIAETERTREEAELNRATIARELEEDRAHAEEIKDQYRKRIGAMEQEFEEIKTNILRTAGKIDGLKAQINEAEIVNDWDIRETADRVDVPEADISVEGALAAEAPAGVEVETASEPVLAFEEPASEPAMTFEEVATEPAFDVSEPTVEEKATEAQEEFTFDDLVAKLQNEEQVEEAPANIPAEGEIDLNDLDGLANEAFTAEPAEPAQTADPVQAAEEEVPIDEISFEGLEELFKE